MGNASPMVKLEINRRHSQSQTFLLYQDKAFTINNSLVTTNQYVHLFQGNV